MVAGESNVFSFLGQGHFLLTTNLYERYVAGPRIELRLLNTSWTAHTTDLAVEKLANQYSVPATLTQSRNIVKDRWTQFHLT